MKIPLLFSLLTIPSLAAEPLAPGRFQLFSAPIVQTHVILTQTNLITINRTNVTLFKIDTATGETWEYVDAIMNTNHTMGWKQTPEYVGIPRAAFLPMK